MSFDLGIGTEKLEEEFKEKYGPSVIRMDADTTRNKNGYSKIIKAFEDKKYNILIGTQMISKGLDFSNVTLVGVINGDATLNIPDFRSAERTYELLSQVSGRAGRASLKGEVIIQTFNEEHYSIEKVKKHDYRGFYNEEIMIRKKLGYPPFYDLTLIKLTSKNENILKEEASKINNYLRNNLKEVIVLGPSASRMYKMNNSFNMQIILKYKKWSLVEPSLTYINDLYKTKKNIRLDININPNKL